MISKAWTRLGRGCHAVAKKKNSTHDEDYGSMRPEGTLLLWGRRSTNKAHWVNLSLNCLRTQITRVDVAEILMVVSCFVVNQPMLKNQETILRLKYKSQYMTVSRISLRHSSVSLDFCPPVDHHLQASTLVLELCPLLDYCPQSLASVCSISGLWSEDSRHWSVLLFHNKSYHCFHKLPVATEIVFF